jgi:histidine ammonia-lyase
MIVQYTAAACCAEMRTLSMPASVSNIPTSGGIEDYNSMGATSGLLLRQSVDLCRSVIAIELLVGCEALDHHRPLRSGDAVETMYKKIREKVPARNCDRPPSDDIAAIESLLS